MVRRLSPREAAERLRRSPEDLLLLDVREPDERAIAAIEPSMFIPLAEVPTRIDELPRDREIVVYCHHGSRSAMAAALLEDEGFTRVANLTGGIDAWAAEVDGKMPRYS